MPDSAAIRPFQLGITTGDPAGIGPEVSLRAAADPELRGRCRLILFGDAVILRSRADLLGLSWDLEPVAEADLRAGTRLPERGIVHIPAHREKIAPGQGSKAAGEAAAQNIVACARACRSGRLDAMVTAPLNKKFFNEAGYSFPGHTEFLAHLSGVSRFAMAFSDGSPQDRAGDDSSAAARGDRQHHPRAASGEDRDHVRGVSPPGTSLPQDCRRRLKSACRRGRPAGA